MRIAFITRAAFGVLGGAASYMLPVLVSKYCEVLVLTVARPNSEENVVFNNPGIKVVNVFSKSNAEIASNALKQLKEFDPDVVHMFQNPRCRMLLSSLHKSLPGVKWAIDFRTPLLADSAYMRIQRLWSFFVSQFYVDHVFTHSMNTIKSNLPVMFRPCSELPPGVDMDLFRRKVPISWERPDKFLYVGVIHDYRRLDLLVKAFARYVRKCNKLATLDIVGGGPAHKKLMAAIEKAKMKKHIRHLGVMPQKDLYAAMADYDVGIAYVPYKRYTKAPSLKSLEYAAAGLPIIASDTHAHKEYCEKYGFHFELFENSVVGIYSALERITKNGLPSDKVAANTESIKRFDWDFIARNDLLPVYEAMLKV